MAAPLRYRRKDRWRSRRCSQPRSGGLNSGEYGGSGRSVMLGGTCSAFAPCPPRWGGRQRQRRDVGRHLQRLRAMPASLVEQERDVHVVGQGRGEAGEEEVHGLRRRLRQHQGEGVVGAGTDGGEDVGGEEALVAAPRRPLATGEPATAGASLLPLSGL